MEGVQIPNRPSLDQLKALNSHGDLSTQLAEANRLCTHRSRADMIVKWLLQKLKSSRETRTNAESWRSLYSAFRLLSPEHLATLLTSNSFFSTLGLALEEIQASDVLLEELSYVLDFLLDFSESSKGASIKAHLSIPAAQAASFLGLWLQSTCQRIVQSPETACSNKHYSILRPAIKIWNLRKPSINDNELFAKHSMAPASLLLSLISSEDLTTTSKRKRDDEAARLEYSCTKMLETLLTRHVFLPARSAFYKAQNPVTNAERKTAGFQHSKSVIQASLEPLKAAIGQQDGKNQAYLEALPLLLGIALRCVATPTPRQRVKEKPWVETLFDTLLECNKKPRGGLLSLNILIRMLKAVGARATLSKEYLEMIVRSHSALSNPSSAAYESEAISLEHWELIAQVIELDPDIFADTPLAELVFISITKAGINIRELTNEEQPSGSGVADFRATAAHLKTLWLQEIIQPIVNAFGRNRNLLTFVDLWSQQLDRLATHDVSYWTEVDDAFAALLEDSLSENQILDLVSRLLGTILDSKLEAGDPGSVSPSNISSSIIVLNGVLRGLRSENLNIKCGEKCEQLLHRLLDIFETPGGPSPALSTSPSDSKRIWALMTKALELWFPSAVANTADTSIIEEECRLLITRKALKTALVTANARHSTDETNESSTREAHDAECFVASICHHVLGVRNSLKPETQDELAETIASLFRQLDPNELQSVMLYPALLLSIQNLQSRRDFLRKCITAEPMSNDVGQIATSDFNTLPALIATTVENAQWEVIDDVMQIAADILAPGQESQSEDQEHAQYSRVTASIHLLSQIPVTAMTRAQREKILDVLSTIRNSQDSLQIGNLRMRLALMVNIMEVPNASCRLSTDHSVIWRIAIGVSASEYVNTHKDRALQVTEQQSVAFLQELARLLVKHLQANQDQERSHAILLDLSKDVHAILEFLCRKGKMGEDHTTALALSVSIMQALENGSKEDLKNQLTHRSQHTLLWLCNHLAEGITERISMISDDQLDFSHIAIATQLNTMLDALSVGAEILAAMGLDGVPSSASAKVQRMLEHIAARTRADAVVEARLLAIKAALVRCFEIGCKDATSGDHYGRIEAVSFLLEMNLSPVETEMLTNAFAGHVKTIGGGARASLLEHLLPLEGIMQRSNLLMLQICLVHLDRDDLPQTAGFVRRVLYPALLRTVIESNDLLSRQRAISCIIVALKTKPFLNSQHSIEELLTSLSRFLDGRIMETIVYLDVCQIMSTLLLNHRARLRGRFHLVVPVYQVLLTWLFRIARPSSPNHTSSTAPTPKHARALARTLTLFCEPVLLRRQQNPSSLTDESRKEQAHVGEFIHSVLHQYCMQVLNHPPNDEMKEALTPGLWSMIDAIEINDADGIKSLSASMSNSERAVLRGLYDEWKAFGKWKGG